MGVEEKWYIVVSFTVCERESDRGESDREECPTEIANRLKSLMRKRRIGQRKCER